MGKTKKPRKAHRPRIHQAGGGIRLQPWRLCMLFDPMESILDRLEAGAAFDVNEAGDILFHSCVTGQTLPVDGVIDAWAELFTIANLREPENCPDPTPLRKLGDKLGRGESLDQNHIDACRRSLTALRRYAQELSGAELKDLVQTTFLKAEMDERDAEAKTNG